MKILHTSDWHLGRSLYGRKRYDEFAAFLDWLAKTIEQERIDALLVAGDLFDTSTPANRAQELYYRFLCTVSNSRCRHVVVIAGNHDSPSFLNAPKELLRALNVHVIGSMTESAQDEVLCLLNNNTPEAIVCAVPYLRDKDIRTALPGETIDDKNARLIDGVKRHYETVCAVAEKKRLEFSKMGFTNVPLIAMGHLFTAGGKTVEGDGVRELYVGSLAHVGIDLFPSSIDYLALGHLHVPQVVGKREHIRYSGSPLPMGYGEANHEKKVIVVDFNGTAPDIKEIKVPLFQQLIRIVGSLDDILTTIEQLKTENSGAWLEIEYTGKDVVGNLRDMLDEAIADSTMEIRRIRNRRAIDRVINNICEEETLDDLDEGDVFARCMDAFDVTDEDREELTLSYNEILRSLQEDDRNAE
ncbi:exonuclease SbcCD subunit D C-terminal domain-containing protein [Chitinispirillales bacterium ANBcel5]|uniref:exonuclease SbcCD subunit D C-terminal domain-containing protein n=1 Tax=Cellulosispirillum alkaliphilum TaxID=3039283 RepID=UPI002A5838BE|nr:exonuclease SbcCD subunit D C-terminal domain-containing protein [Chitinispirillales bacterium ANBcel5]